MQPTALDATTSRPWWQSCRWTLGLCAAMAVFNLGLFPGTPTGFERLVELLQFDRGAILDGQLWRLLTGNLVHWSPEHFFLDVGAFAVVGLLYERHLGRNYPWVLLLAGLAVGGGMLVFLPEMSIYRGLSGVDSGQFAAAVCAELCLARRDRRRWLWVAPAAAVFLLKIVSECATGQMFFGTESLGNIGDPVPLAHAAGTVAAVVFLLCVVPDAELFEQITSVEPRPPRQVDDTIPKELERICLKALSKRVTDRYMTAKDMADDLRHFLAGNKGGNKGVRTEWHFHLAGKNLRRRAALWCVRERTMTVKTRDDCDAIA